VQVSFDIDANGMLQVSATDRTTGRQQSVSIQGGSNLSEEEIQRLLDEAERKNVEDRRRRAEVDRRNRAQTLVAQAERRLRDAALELGPYGAERQQRSVELALRDVQDLLVEGDAADLELAVSQLQEALFGLNRRLLSERKADVGPLQGLRNTLGTLKDELFADDDWDDWDRPPRSDPWDTPPRRREEDRWRDPGRRAQPDSWSDVGVGRPMDRGLLDRGYEDQSLGPSPRDRADTRKNTWGDQAAGGGNEKPPRWQDPFVPSLRRRDLASPEDWQAPSPAVDRARPRGIPAPSADPWGDDPTP
jgi:molecular chaperone DnaK